jgi:DNA-binding transcriptional regulator YiaG
MNHMSKINVSRLRASLGETQAQFAERLGVDQSAVSRWEEGIRIPSGPATIILSQLERERIARQKKAELRAAG